ncbi:chromosome partitioning protein ParB [Scytonema hofmannii PCC 7110]|uniref:Chromosome partitioning protein ParB n=1 Tax=Scytonema hofmannii PCC 7110 TaxID=128403 RepID=A0A139WQ08_9CYAN|nr:ParB/RepB/Spo0J family partition protein [Scytonema hofmannii]KYC34520.1 chromosome partitioning protein ParB [Scytonema hofmannii PCC 7110]
MSDRTLEKMSGLDDLFGEPEANLTPQATLPIEQIVLPESQPRRYFDQEKLESLANSIKEVGLLEPIVVRPIGDDAYELIAGERRLKACKIAKLENIAVNIIECDETRANHIRLIENLQREDLNPVEETEGILALLALRLSISQDEIVKLLQKMENEAKGKITRNVTGSPQAMLVEEIFSALGRMKWDSFVRNRLPLLRLPENILVALRSGEIEYTKARAIAQVKSDSDRATILDKAIKDSLSLEEIKALTKTCQGEITTPEIQLKYKELTKKLGVSKVWENPKKRKALEKLLNQIEQLLDAETSAD